MKIMDSTNILNIKDIFTKFTGHPMNWTNMMSSKGQVDFISKTEGPVYFEQVGICRRRLQDGYFKSRSEMTPLHVRKWCLLRRISVSEYRKKQAQHQTAAD